MADLHTTLSFSSGGALKQAIRKNLLTGEVVVINDLPGIGPLDDGIKRMAFLKGLNFEKEGANWSVYDTNAFAVWRQLQQRLSGEEVDRLVIWAGSDGHAYVFVRMACHWLKQSPVAIALVQAPPIMGYHSLDLYAAEQLAPLIGEAVVLSAATLDRLAAEYEDIVPDPRLLRECDVNGVLQFLDLSAHDDQILAFCGKGWTKAVRVIGQAMGHSDPRNSLGDAFVSSRLEHLIRSGQVEADGPRSSMRDFRMRLARK